MTEEEELYVDPAFFAALLPDLPGLEEARIRVKRGAARNELSAFRYQAVLGPAAEGAPLAAELHWSRDRLGLAALAARLEDGTAPFAVEGIPNARLAAEAQLLRWLQQPGEATLEEWRRQPVPAGIEPEALHALAARHGWALELATTAGAPARCAPCSTGAHRPPFPSPPG
ncbi:hypothetical protein ACFQU7_37785 [Pseudoroseomonas wenyumeiae]